MDHMAITRLLFFDLLTRARTGLSSTTWRRFRRSSDSPSGCARSGRSRWTDSSARRPSSGANARSASGVAMGRGRRRAEWPYGCAARSTARCCESSLGVVTRRSIAPSSVLPRRTQAIPRSAVVPMAAPRSRASGTSSMGLAIARCSLARGDVHAAPRRCVFGATPCRPSRLD